MGGEMYPTGQPLDHEPSLGQVPVVPPGTPPSEAWAHYNGLPPHPGMPGYMGAGRRSPNLPGNMSQPQPPMIPSSEPIMMGVGGPPGMMNRMLAHDMDEQYNEYPPQTHNQLEVY